MRDEAVATACRGSLRQSQALLQAPSVESVEYLRKVLRDANRRAWLTAARTILDLWLKAVELAKVEERLAKLETIAKNRNWKGASDKQCSATPRGVNGHA